MQLIQTEFHIFSSSSSMNCLSCNPTYPPSASCRWNHWDTSICPSPVNSAGTSAEFFLNMHCFQHSFSRVLMFITSLCFGAKIGRISLLPKLILKSSFISLSMRYFVDVSLSNHKRFNHKTLYSQHVDFIFSILFPHYSHFNLFPPNVQKRKIIFLLSSVFSHAWPFSPLMALLPIQRPLCVGTLTTLAQ